MRVDRVQMYDARGKLVGTGPTDLQNDGLAYSIHRTDVHRLLVESVAPENVHLRMECTQVIDGLAGAVVAFADGSQVRTKVVVGADSIKSVVRRFIVDDEPAFQNLVVFRGIAPATAMPHGLPNDRIYTWGSDPPMMTSLPLRAEREVAMDTIIARDRAPRELWTSEVSTDELLGFLNGFDPAVRDMIRAGTVPVRANAVYDREPLKRWSTSRTTLLGDAAHPMAPLQGQGANTAIQDAGALAAALAACGIDVPSRAFARYENERVALTRTMQLASREKGIPTAKRAPAVQSGIR